MAIRIQTQDTFIPVEIGDLKLKFDISDESLKRLQKEMENIQKLGLDFDEEENALEQAKKVTKRAYDEIFGEGTFDKVYDISPSTSIVLTYLAQIGEGLQNELERRGLSNPNHEKVNKYLAKKK